MLSTHTVLSTHFCFNIIHKKKHFSGNRRQAYNPKIGSLERIPEGQQAQSVATVLAIGTATPPTFINQTDFPDFLFRSTKTEHLTSLKQKFTRMCDKSMVKKRHYYITEDFLKEHPEISTFDEPSLDTRQKILMKEVPKLGMEAAVKAIEEWGQPKSRLTHLIFCTSSGTTMPSADHELTRILGLSPSVKKFMLYHQACSAGGAALRLARDLAESDRTARILVVGSENMLGCFRAPREGHESLLVSSAIFGDGAGAVVVGADPDVSEHPLFQLLSARQVTIPGSEEGVVAHVREMGYVYNLSRLIPTYVRDNIVECVKNTVEPYGITDFNSVFYVVHPGGSPVLKAVEEELCLTEEKLETSWHVLREYGNMWSPSVFFVLDEMRKRSKEQGKATTGDGKEFGVLFVFGPGITVETMMLRSVAT